jgi:hypothetical protein
VPPPLKIRSPQRIVSLQHLHYQIELESLRCSDIDTVTREPYKVFKHIQGHTDLRYQRTVARIVRFKYPAKPLVQCESDAHEFRGDIDGVSTECIRHGGQVGAAPLWS